MKKAVLFIAALITGTMLMAQEQGEFSLTGALLLSGGNTIVSTNVDGHTTTANTSTPLTFDLGVGVGYFVANNLEVSLGLYYGLNREQNDFSTSENAYYNSVSSFTFKPEVAYYVPLTRGKFFWKPAFQLGFKSNSTKQQVNKETITREKLPFTFTMGLDIFAFELRPWKHLGFDFSLGGLYYNTTSSKTSTEVASIKTRVNNVSFGFNNVFSPTLGVKYIF
ncbi:MAG: outer membrane beta-barrel protein [Bacteroidales bacterium]|nr:outer membrane beta-barrel protein [Bacteroidales bacterium]